MTLGKLLSRFESPHFFINRWVTPCPLHEYETEGTLSIYTDGAEIKVICDGGCSIDAILWELDLSEDDLVDEDFEEPEELEEDTSELLTVEQKVFIPTLSNCPTDSKTLMTVSDIKILSTGNISIIVALAGSGKSALLEAACASKFNPTADTLGVSLKANSFFYIDTERSIYDFHMSWQRFLKRGNLDHIPSSGLWRNIRLMDTVTEKQNFVFEILDSPNAPEIVLLDGIGDICKNVNDGNEAVEIVSKISAIIERRHIALLATLHSNPNDKNLKARGHLGSELWRKAESVLAINKFPNSDIRELTSNFILGKNRSALDNISSCFHWDTNIQTHASCPAPSASKSKGKTVVERDKIIKLIHSKSSWVYSELVKEIIAITGKSLRTAKGKITDAVECGDLVKNSDGTYSAVPKSASFDSDEI